MLPFQHNHHIRMCTTVGKINLEIQNPSTVKCSSKLAEETKVRRCRCFKMLSCAIETAVVKYNKLLFPFTLYLLVCFPLPLNAFGAINFALLALGKVALYFFGSWYQAKRWDSTMRLLSILNRVPDLFKVQMESTQTHISLIRAGLLSVAQFQIKGLIKEMYKANKLCPVQLHFFSGWTPIVFLDKKNFISLKKRIVWVHYLVLPF